ncbi:hypothetical protein VSDG_08547 [Cytospora chrysosperma]|uniref:Gfd2/YDR514C-like C-terminal domain-containing protein n=1 Tax=Cytospora chrysosperma TaxID=252740 RepID=A0A423VF91_CYTCH|nr:hypothetical protein VSDG_08547 [Valsa sordida]
MGSNAIENLRKMFGDQNIWEKPPQSPEKVLPILSPQHATCPRGIESTPKQKIKINPSVFNEPYSSSDEELVVNARNCTNKVLPEFRRGKQHGNGSKSVRFDNNETASLSSADLQASAFQHLGLKEGDKAPESMAFVPWKFLVRYPEMYVGKTNNPLVTPYFEEDALFQHHHWDFFYLFEPDERVEYPILLVPTRQLEALLRRINKQHNIHLTIPGGGNESKFYRRFGGLGTPLPRYLGRTSDAASYKRLLAITPLPEPDDDLTKLTQIQRDEFEELVRNCKESWQGGSGKGKNQRKKKAVERLENRKDWGHQTKRVQRYMGLRKKSSPNAEKLTALDVNEVVPFENEGNVVFICVDVETYEKSPGLVTELGFAILDTQDLVGVPPGEGAQDWFKLIQARHLRIKEYSYMKNTEYVVGCPESFVFGNSEFVPLDKILKVTDEIMSPRLPSGELRKVVFIGHDVKQDIALLESIDFDVYEMRNLLEVVDNQKLHQHRHRFYNGQGLSAVLAGLEIPYMFLHNAGNDAVYTLQSLIRLAVLKRQESLARGSKDKTTSVVRDVEYEANPEAGWSTGGEDTDGGAAELKDPKALQKQLERMRLEYGDDE